MKKIDSSFLVCSAENVERLLALGINPAACNCYESVAGNWEFAGEYFGQDPVIPAWTMEELNILIGGDIPRVIRTAQPLVKYPKPDLYRESDWMPNANMMKYILHLPRKRVETLNGADAYAVLLYELLVTGEVKPEECNARLDAFITKETFNPKMAQLQKEARGK